MSGVGDTMESWFSIITSGGCALLIVIQEADDQRQRIDDESQAQDDNSGVRPYCGASRPLRGRRSGRIRMNRDRGR